MEIFTMLAIALCFSGITSLMYAAGSKKQAYLYVGYLLSMSSVLCSQAGMIW
ncbi:hypothetical protein PUG81_17260 [Erwiniaceae bacterium L1_54_6]|jgi:hypothetical protein|nr:hypothetical protein [Erwiniaceae bacterium L1_54_6]